MICFLWNDTTKFTLGKKDSDPLNPALQNTDFPSVSDSFSKSVVHIPLEYSFSILRDLFITNHPAPVHLLIFVLRKNSHCASLKTQETELKGHKSCGLPGISRCHSLTELLSRQRLGQTLIAQFKNYHGCKILNCILLVSFISIVVELKALIKHQHTIWQGIAH